MASTIGDDPAGQCLTMSTGGQGADTIVKAMAEGTDEVKDLLRHEAEFIIECRYCRNLYRSIPNFLSHKRQYCRTICRNALASDIIAKQVEEFGERILNDKVSPPQSTRKNAGQSRRNIAAMFQKKVQSTIVVPDEFNKVELHSLPNISRAVPQTSFFDGQQWIVKQNKNMAVKEHLDTDDRSILIMPQDTNVSQRAGDMTLRRRKLVDVQEKEMTGRELIVLDYIPASVRHHINPASCTCNYPSCTGLKAFESLLSLAYHLTLKHNRPLTEKETIQMRRGREGMFLCFLCSTTHGSSDKLVTHLKKEHAEVLAAHEEFRTKQRNELPGRSRRRLEPSQRSMSPQFNNDAPSAEEDNEEDGANVEEVPETRESTPPPAKPKTRASSAKKPIAKKILPKRMQRRRRRAETVETPTSQSSQPIPRLIDADPEISMINSQKSVTPTGTLDEVARRLSTTNSPPSVTTSESPEPAPAVLLTCKEEPVSGITEGTGEAPPEPPASTHPQHETSSRLTTRSPSVDGDPIIRRSQRAHRRRPLHFDEYATTEREFRAHSAGRVKRARLTSPLPPSTTPAPKVRISFRHEARDADEDEEEDIKPIIKRPLPTTESVTVGKGPVLPRPTGVTSAIVKTRQALSATIRKVRTTTAPTTPSNGKYGGAGVDDLEAWVMPTEDSNSGTESLPFTPRAQEAIAVTKGSSRRKQRLDISDDGNNDLTVLSSPEEDDDQPARPEDLAALPIILTTADETIFYQALKPRFKEGTDGNHQCAECGEVLLSLCEGRKHMIGHVRAVRFRCALCDSGAFYVEAMREHLLNRHCPGLHMASQFCTPGIPCMTTKNADGLTKIVCPENPGKFMFTSGKIVTQDNPKPHRPDPKAEENILGPCQPPRLSPSKSLAILNHTRSPMKNFSQMHAHLQPSTMSPAVDHPSTSTSRPMYATSSQKRHWTFSSPAHLAEQRAAVNARFISRHEPYVDNPSQLSEFLTSDDEVLLCRVVSETGSRFSKDFQPSLPLPVRWISFMYFKRFYTKCSALAYAPKNIMMACFFLAAKVYEFNITTRQFVSNLRSGTPESNIEFILKLEPKLMEELDYELTVHTPYKAFEGHLIEMKTRMPLLGFDLEQLRPFAYQFFEKALITDAMLLYAPTHIALAALKYALEKADKSLEILRDFFYKFLDLDHFNSRDEDKEQVEKLIQRVTEINDMVLLQIQPLSPDASTALKVRIHNFSQLLNTFEERMRGVSTEQEDVYMSDSD